MNIIYFARDPGGADVISECIQKVTSDSVVVWAKDYARKVFERNGIAFHDFNETILDQNLTKEDESVVDSFVQQYLQEADIVITATTHYEDWTERLLWRKLQDTKVKSAAVLDGKIRVGERFVVDGERYAPDCIFAVDEEDIALLRELGLTRQHYCPIGFPFLQKRRMDAERSKDKIENTRKEVEALAGKKFDRLVVYVSEPQSYLDQVGAQYDDVSFTEIDIYRDLYSALHGQENETLLAVKLHPKEDGSQYDGLDAFLLPKEFDKDLLLAAADVVVGMKSMLLLEAVLFDNVVVSVDYWGVESEQLLTNIVGGSLAVKDQKELSEALQNTGALRERIASEKFLSIVDGTQGWADDMTKVLQGVIAS